MFPTIQWGANREIIWRRVANRLKTITARPSTQHDAHVNIYIYLCAADYY